MRLLIAFLWYCMFSLSVHARGKLGLRYQKVPEGLLVVAIESDMGADRAGLSVGDIILGVDGFSGQKGEDALRNTEGESSSLRIKQALTGKEVTIVVPRGIPPQENTKKTLSIEVQRFQQLMKDGAVRKIAAALNDIPIEERNYRTIGRPLLVARKHRRPYSKILAKMKGIETKDIQLIVLLSELFWEQQDHAEVLRLFRRYNVLRQADYSGSSQFNFAAEKKMLEMAVSSFQHQRDEQGARQWKTILEQADISRQDPQSRSVWRTENSPIDNFEVSLLDGTSWSMKEHRGKIVVLNFWASWCGPCQQELPALEKWSQQNPDVAVLAISLDDKEALARKKARQLGLDIPFAYAPEIGARLGIEALPSMRVVDPQGAIAYESRGFSAKTFEKIDAAVAALQGVEKSESVWAEVFAVGAIQPTLKRYTPVKGIVEAIENDGIIWVATEDEMPFALVNDRSSSQQKMGGLRHGENAGYLNGILLTDQGGFLLRQFSEKSIAWSVGFPNRIRGFVVQDKRIWVATEQELVLLDEAGRLLRREKMSVRSLSASERGVWVLGEEKKQLLQFKNGAFQILKTMECLGVDIDRFGGVAGSGVVDVVWWQNARREQAPIFLREDHVLIGMESGGGVSFLIQLSERSSVFTADIDQDLDDELLIVIPKRGLAIIELTKH